MARLCDAARSQLLVVDVQEKFTPVMPAQQMEQVLVQTHLLMQVAEKLNIPTLVTEQYPKGLGPTNSMLQACMADSSQTYEKTRFSCCGADGFNDTVAALAKDQVIIVGMETHVCVLQTALELLEQGKEVYVCEDAVVSRYPQHYENALARMGAEGVVITNAESVVFEWLRDAKHPDFKIISQWLK